MNAYIQPLTEYSEFEALKDSISRGRLPARVTGCTDSQKAHLIAGLSETKRVKLVLAPNELRARALAADLQLYDRHVLYYPAKDIIFYSADVSGNAIVRERLNCIRKLMGDEPVTIVAGIMSGMDKVMPLEKIEAAAIHISSTDTIDIDALAERLNAIGYDRTEAVEEPGEFSVRGGIIDIYPLAEASPYRIELWGDSIDSIRIFDPASQRSIVNAERVDIYPAVEYVLTQQQLLAGLGAVRDECASYTAALRKKFETEKAARIRKTVEEFAENIEYLKNHASIDSYIDYFEQDTVSFFDYFANEDSLVFIDEPGRAFETAEASETEFEESMKGRLESGYILPGQMRAAFNTDIMVAKLQKVRPVMLSVMEYKVPQLQAVKNFALNVRSISSYNGNFEMLVGELQAWKKTGYRVVLLTNSGSRAVRLAEDLAERGLNAFTSDSRERLVQPGEIKVVSGAVSRGFEYPLIKFAIISETDIFGKQKTSRRQKKYEGTKIPDFTRLAAGDYVVHENYGVGIYRGIEKIEVDHVVKDYIKVEYAGGGTLYVLASAMDKLQKYAGPEGRVPKVNRLDSGEWTKTTNRVRGAVKEIAGELVRLYAMRQAKAGYRYSRDSVWQKEFEEAFPFEETNDQLRAIEETKQDMESSRIMDRLICGDVGYGKTEVAIRAAFKAVQDSRQVAVLVPTTVLAQQHYNTFTQRMKEFPVRVEMLSRFRTPAEQKKTLQRLKEGQVDIVIGTHRLLSKDVEFKNLGLLVIDEEQRFGVTHKEKIKQLRGDVDVLTLTATPIPRTLHMSLVGIRDMSLLDEPPVDRLPIQTFVLEHNDEMIREAINRELARGGQVYYVYNRVNGISDIAARIQMLVPEANVVYAHGQMNERELENVMFSFVNGEIDVLVSTTIIETGLDISNVNTIIIDDADRLGLSQLYQLRGRVGRSSRTAYAFLMYKRDRQLREVAEKRLEAIREFTELGSGFKIAMRDLEIRGAGNLLGAEQSGHMEAVGYDLYCKMLNQAVSTLKLGDAEPETWDTTIDLDMDAFIPSTYIRNELQKLDMYKRIANIGSKDSLTDLEEELTDRYGDIPAAVINLLYIALTKNRAHDVFVTGITQKGRVIRLNLYARAGLDIGRITELMSAFDNRLTFKPAEKVPYFEYTLAEIRRGKPGPMPPAEIFGQLGQLIDALEGIKL